MSEHEAKKKLKRLHWWDIVSTLSILAATVVNVVVFISTR